MRKNLFFVLVFLLCLSSSVFSQVPLTVKESDEQPKVTFPTQLIFPPGSLSRSGSRITVAFPASSGGTVTHTGALTLNQIVVGNGSADTKTFAFGTGNQYLSMNSGATALEWKTLSITNADVNAAAAIAYSKLNLTGAILNADLAGSIAYSKLSLTGAIVNNDLAGSIAQSKITNLTSDLAAKAPLASPVFTGQPTIPDFTNSTHSHQNNAGGGTLDAAAIAAGTLASARSGTGSAFFAISGPSALQTYVLPDANATIARTDAAQTFTGVQVFSSAPTFSTMTAGSVLFAGASGALTQNNSKLFWDAGNERLGIGTSSPARMVEISAASGVPGFKVTHTGIGAAFLFYVGAGGAGFGIFDEIAAADRIIVDSAGNILFGGITAAGTSAAKVLVLANGTAPSSSPANAVQIYSEGAEAKVRDGSGNITTFSPHNFSLIPGGPSEEMAWAFYSERDEVAINVDMLKLARWVEKLTGDKLVYIQRVKK